MAQLISTVRSPGGPPPPAQNLAILLLHHDSVVTHVPLAPGVPVVLGRDPSANVVLHDASLSRTHARIFFDGKQHVIVQDLHSKNGTISNGHNLDKPTAVGHGSAIFFGAIMGIVLIPFGPQASTSSVESDIVADAKSMKPVIELVNKYAKATAPVLIGGETGTGKEEIAKLIHQRGSRRNEPFVVLNCASIPPQLLESLLFGHEKGAFTGASSQTKGYFEAARGGTVLLDEIGELSLAAQAALLRVIETGKIVRVGSIQETPLNVRWIAATWRNLKAMCKEGSFREDLYHRLGVLTIDVPPLRERTEDIPALVGRFLQRANQMNGRHVQGIESDALRVLMSYSWPGNIRELRNWIERAVVVSQGDTIRLADLPRHIEAQRALPSLEGRNLDADKSAVEKAALYEALRHSEGDTDEAARLLGKSRRTIQRLIKKYDSEPDSGDDS